MTLDEQTNVDTGGEIILGGEPEGSRPFLKTSMEAMYVVLRRPSGTTVGNSREWGER